MEQFIFGYISGMAGILVSHPFDTIKTHIQSNKPIPRSLNGLYRGIGPPLIGVGLEKSIVFGVYIIQSTIQIQHLFLELYPDYQQVL